MSKQVAVKDYALKMGVSTPAVTMACKEGKKLIGISKYQKLGAVWILTKAAEYDTTVGAGKIIADRELKKSEF